MILSLFPSCTMTPKTAAFSAIPGATLEDYRNFHGMLCRPSTAQRCIDSFTGTILFIPEQPSSSTSETISTYDCSNGMLNLWSYYLLVLFSLTGLSTLFKQTKFLVGENVADAATIPFHQAQANDTTAIITSTHITPPLHVDKHVLNYVMQQTNSASLQLRRRFEYHFGGVIPVSVIMLHFQCNKGLLHLVEVYRAERAPSLFGRLTSILGNAVRWIVEMTGKKKKSA